MVLTPSKYGGGLTVSTSTRVALTDNVEYTCPCDGYFRIYHASGSGAVGAYCEGYINSATIACVASPSTGYTVASQMAAIFVREGMKIKFHGTSGTSNGYFYPLA